MHVQSKIRSRTKPGFRSFSSDKNSEQATADYSTVMSTDWPIRQEDSDDASKLAKLVY